MAKIKRNCRSCSWIWIHVQSFAAYAAKSLRNVVKFHAVDALNRCQKLIFPQYKFNYIIFKWSCKYCIKLVHFRKIPFKIFINFLFYEWVIFLYVNFQFFGCKSHAFLLFWSKLLVTAFAFFFQFRLQLKWIFTESLHNFLQSHFKLRF